MLVKVPRSHTQVATCFVAQTRKTHV